MSHNFKKAVSEGRWPQEGQPDPRAGAGAARSPCGTPRQTGAPGAPSSHRLLRPLSTSRPQSTCLSPSSAQAPTPRPPEGRGGPQEPVLRPAGSAGRRRGAWRTGRPPWGWSPGSQAWRGFRTRTPGAGRPRSALGCPFPLERKPSLPRTPVLCVDNEGGDTKAPPPALPHPHRRFTRLPAMTSARGGGMWAPSWETEFQI